MHDENINYTHKKKEKINILNPKWYINKYIYIYICIYILTYIKMELIYILTWSHCGKYINSSRRLPNLWRNIDRNVQYCPQSVTFDSLNIFHQTFYEKGMGIKENSRHHTCVYVCVSVYIMYMWKCIWKPAECNRLLNGQSL